MKKTGGRSWNEIDLVDDTAVRQFASSTRTAAGSERRADSATNDGGKTWTRVELGKAANKIRLLKTGAGWVGYAIGVDVHKLIVER